MTPIPTTAATTAGLPEEFVTYLMDAVEPRPEAGDGLRVGDPVVLRTRADGRAVEAWSPSRGRLGRLPTDDGEALAAEMSRSAMAVAGRISALIPRPGRVGGGTRIHIRVGGVAVGT